MIMYYVLEHIEKIREKTEILMISDAEDAINSSVRVFFLGSTKTVRQ